MQSPYLDANPSLLTLLSEAVPSKTPLSDGEYTKFVLYDFHHRKVFESKLAPLIKGKPNLNGIPKVGFAKNKFVWLSYLIVRDGRQYWSRRKYFLQNSGGSTSLNDSGAAFHNQRRDAMARVYLPPGKRSHDGSQPKTLRLNPEVRTKFRQGFTEGNNGGYFFSPALSTEEIYRRTWSGTSTPGFGGLKKAQRPVNNHSVTIVDTSDMGLLDMIEIPSSGIYFNQYSAMTRCYNAPALPSHDATATSKAFKKLVERMESGIEGNIAQDVLQIRQTISLITDTAKKMAKAGLSLKNGNIPGAARALWGTKPPRYRRGREPHHSKSAADNWLSMQYGWKPLLQDLHGAMEACARLHLSDASIKQVAASARTTKWVVEDLPLFLNSHKVGGWTRVQTQSRCKFGVRFTVDNHLLAFLAQSGFTNPVNLLWEVIPFSFVYDWFQPIGPWLESLSAFHGLVFLDGYQTKFTKQITESLVRFSGEFQAGQNLVSGGSYSRQVVLLDRVKLNAFPTLSFPSFKNPLSLTHASNALALVMSVFKR